MARVMFRLSLLAIGIGLLEQFLPFALFLGGPYWLTVTAGLALVAAGSAGFIVPLFDPSTTGGSSDPH